MAKDNTDSLYGFRRAIVEFEDLLFGTVLFSEGCYVVHSAYVGQFDHSYIRTLQRGSESIARARSILLRAERSPEHLREVESFEFPPWTDEMRQRALVLVETYDEVFPGRARHVPLTLQEHEALMQKVLDTI